jgi:periplasmic protein CpxP/Spy
VKLRRTKQTQTKQKFMKSNKMTLIAALAVGSLLVLSPATRAQDSTNAPAASTPAANPGGGMRGRGPSLDQLAKTLNLTDAQKTQIKPILDAQQQKMRDLMQDTTLSREDKTAKRKTLHEDTAAQLKPILSADQMAQWEKMSQPRQRGGQKTAPAGGDKPADAAPATPPAAAPQN